jgi:NitT/TauT family transport system permease protein
MPEIFVKAVVRCVIAIAIVVLVWEGVAAVVPPYVLPHLGPVLGKIVESLFTGDLATHVLASVFRIVTGYVMALVIGLPLGLALRQVPELRFALGALFAGLAAVPFVLLAPLTILWGGFGSGPKIGLAFAAAGFALVNGLMTSGEAIGPSAPGDGPSAAVASAPLAPSVVEAVRTAFLVAVGAVLVSEMLGSQTGLGYLMMYATSTMDIAAVFAVVIVVALPCALVSAFLRSIAVQVG